MESFFDHGGRSTARVPTAGSTDEAGRRAQQRARARTGTAAMVADALGGVEALRADPGLARLAADEFSEALAMLGLGSAPARAAGTCHRQGCTKLRPMLSASASGAGGSRKWMRMGYCSAACWSEDT